MRAFVATITVTYVNATSTNGWISRSLRES